MSWKHLLRRSIQCTNRRWKSYSSNEYPWANEPPIITKITSQQAKQLPKQNPSFQRAPLPDQDPFDDAQSLSETEVSHILEMQSHIPTKLDSSSLDQPPQLPFSNTPLDASASITRLDNGVRVVSQDDYGPVTTLGMVWDRGSRSDSVPGTTHVLELLLLGQTPSFPDPIGTITNWGGAPLNMSTREQNLLCLEVLRPHVPESVALLGSLAHERLLHPEEVAFGKEAVKFQLLPENTKPETILQDVFQQAAFGKGSLGQPHFVQDPGQLDAITLEHLQSYWRQTITQNPEGIVIGAVGVNHDELVRDVRAQFGSLVQAAPPRFAPSPYQGGAEYRNLPSIAVKDLANLSEMDRERLFTHVMVGFPVGGWKNEKDLVTACVLQSLLGGGSSFSAGGPGKGMYSRLYRRVLNGYRWVEKAEATTQFFDDVGILALQGSADPRYARDLIKILCHHLGDLARTPVDDDELQRAKNMLRSNVLMQLESRLVKFEDLSRQLLTYDRYETMAETAAKIESVTREDLQNLMIESLQSPPTLAVAGMRLENNLPHYDEIKQWF